MKTVQKKWGNELWIVNNKKYCGKILTLNAGQNCSLHYHKIKHETFYVLSGEAILEYGRKKRLLSKGDVQTIPIGMKHRIIATTKTKIIEFSTQHFDSDSHRISTD